MGLGRSQAVHCALWCSQQFVGGAHADGEHLSDFGEQRGTSVRWLLLQRSCLTLFGPYWQCIEPYTSNIYVRRTLAGEFVCVSRHLLDDLVRRGLWCPAMKNKLIAHNGSVQNIREVPQDLKDLYKTVWELSGKVLVDMAADRGAYIDQSQSFNVVRTLSDCRNRGVISCLTRRFCSI